MAGSIEAPIGFSARQDAPIGPDEMRIPGFPDNRVEFRSCRIHDARQAGTSLDNEGFAILRHQTALADERDPDRLKAGGYNEELAGFLKDYLGADLVLAHRYGLCVRNGLRLAGRNPGEELPDLVDREMPASFAHIDFLPHVVLPGLASQVEYECGIDMADYSRLAVVQVWRAVSQPPQDVPLALCDRRTLDTQDVPERTGVHPPFEPGTEVVRYKIGGVHYNAGQRWYYFPDMQADEVLLFMAFDTAREDGWKVCHAAFDNRCNEPQARPRESIETRFYVLFR